MTAATDRRIWLAEARERSGRSQEQLAHALGVTATTVSNWERGVSTPRPAVRPPMADALGFTMAELGRRLGLDSAPEQAALNGDGSPLRAIAEWLSIFVRVEQSAYAIWTLVTSSLPALCQTAGYARAVEAGGYQAFTPDQIDELVQRRMARAVVVDQGAQLVALIPAPLLEAATGGPDVMAEQLGHLLALADRPNVTILVIDGGHLFAAPGPFTLLATAGPDPDVATEFGVAGPRLDEGPPIVAEYVRLFDHLAALARGSEASRAAIARAADRFAAMTATNKRGTP
jgi:transcriptional regulator with XRE-family HTH domain